MNHKDLITFSAEVLEANKGTFLSPEDHLQKYLTVQDFSDVDATFISEVYSGCLRYGSILHAVTDAFYASQGKSVPMTHQSTLNILTYLGLFRLDEIQIHHYRKFIRTQDFNIMYKFMSFFTNETSLKTWMKDEWSKLYDTAFVQNTLLTPFLRSLPQLHEIVAELKGKVDATNSSPKNDIPITIIKEFNLTKPRPRSIPIPQPLPKLQTHKMIPKSTYEEPKEFDELKQQKMKNRRTAEKTLMGATTNQLKCANPSKSTKTLEKLEKIRQEENEKLQFNRYKANPIPKEVMQTDVPIKLNAAAIMREGKLFREREKEVIKKIELLESGAHDPSKFIKWQTDMRQKDFEAELAAVERRRIEGKLSHEEAILARQRLINDNQKKVDEMKQETEELMKRYVEERLAEEQLMRSLVETILSGRENAKAAKKKLVQYKAKLVQEVNEESKELMRQALERAEEEMKKKIELIHQIRAMEAAPINRNKLVDFTETAGYGFLNEMSIAELKERLGLLKQKQAEEEERKRTEIVSDKQAKDQMLLDTLTVISKHRAEDTRAKAEQRANYKANSKDTKSYILEKDQNLVALQDLLDQKKAERVEMQHKAKTKSNYKSPIPLKNNSEVKRWAELEKTKKRIATLESQGLMNNSRLTEVDGSRLAVGSRPFIMT